MKVLLVVHQYLPRHVTGTEQYVRSVARGLRARGVDARVFAYEPLPDPDEHGGQVLARDEVVEGVPVHRVGLHSSLAPTHTLRDYENPLIGALLGRHLDRHGYDVVHTFHLRNIGASGIREPVFRGIPVIVNLMDFWFLCANYLLWHRDGHLCDGPPDGGMGCIPCVQPDLWKTLDSLGLTAAVRAVGALPKPLGVASGSAVHLAHALVRRQEHLLAVLEDAAVLVAPSKFLRDIFVGAGVAARRIRHVPYGLDPGRFAAMPARKAPGAGRVDVGFVGSISRHKGVHVLLEALQYLRSPRDAIHVHVYGRIHSQPGFSESLVEACTDPRVTFHGKFPPNELGAVLAGLDVLAVPSLWYENTPFSVLEALHIGLPVVASDRGGISEIVRDGQNGRLFPAGDARALAAVLDEIVADPAGHLQVVATPSTSIADNAASFVAIYEEQIAAGRQL